MKTVLFIRVMEREREKNWRFADYLSGSFKYLKFVKMFISEEKRIIYRTFQQKKNIQYKTYFNIYLLKPNKIFPWSRTYV